MTSSSSSSAVRQLQNRLHQKGPNDAKESIATSRSRHAPGSAGTRGVAKNRAAGARLTPLETDAASRRTRSRSRGPTPSTTARASPALRSVSRDFSSTAGHQRVARSRGPEGGGEPPAKVGFANSTGGVRKPQKPPLAKSGVTSSSSNTAIPHSPAPSTVTGADSGSTFGAKMVPSRPSVRRAGVHSAQQKPQEEPLARSASMGATDLSGGGGRGGPDRFAAPVTAAQAASPVAVGARGAISGKRGSSSPQDSRPAAQRTEVSPPLQAPLPPARKRQLPVSEHDMDFGFYRNHKNWNSGLCDLPGGASSENRADVLSITGKGAADLVGNLDLTVDRINYLLTGKELEPPFASFLWAQCEPDPVHATADRQSLVDNDSDESTTCAKLHLYKEALVDGYFRCVRCHTPICAPEYFWRPWQQQQHGANTQSSGKGGINDADSSMPSSSEAEIFTRTAALQSHRSQQRSGAQELSRGYACFTHVHTKGLRVELVVAAADRSNASVAKKHTLKDPFAYTGSGTSGEEVDMFRQAKAYGQRRGSTAPPTAVVFCANCDGCLGVLSFQNNNSEEVFLANSMCLQYVGNESTRADMTGHLLLGGDGTSASNASSARAATAGLSNGGWMAHNTPNSAAGGPHHRLNGLPLTPKKTRQCLVFQPGSDNADDSDGGGSEARVVMVERPVEEEEREDDEEGDGARVGGGAAPAFFGPAGNRLGAWAAPAASTGGGLGPSHVEDDDVDGIFEETMFDDLDDEALYL